MPPPKDLCFFVVFFLVLAPGPNDSNLGVSESSDSSLAGLLSGPRAEGYSSLWLTQPWPERRHAASATTAADADGAKQSPRNTRTCTWIYSITETAQSHFYSTETLFQLWLLLNKTKSTAIKKRESQSLTKGITSLFWGGIECWSNVETLLLLKMEASPKSAGFILWPAWMLNTY